MNTQVNTTNHVSTSYSQIACIGTGLSAIALGATLKRWYDMDDIQFFERHTDCGGTWHISSYPGKSFSILVLPVL
jgi:cation diffusion facilitator CzcD-associated flavoprotein CzcO